MRRQQRDGAARFLLDDMVEDVIERLGFLRHRPARAALVGDRGGVLAEALGQSGAAICRLDPAPGPGEQPLDEEAPWPAAGFDFIASLATLDTVNDLPGALLHARAALAPGGLFIAGLVGAGSLPRLRAALLATDADRPAARLHPMVDVRAGAALLQRAGFADPVADSRHLVVRYRAVDRLIADLRDQAAANVLANAPPPLGRTSLTRLRHAFLDGADAAGAVEERFEIVTLTGWRGASP